MFARVAAVRYAKSKVKVKVFEEASLEVMPLDHTEAVNGLVTDRELNAAVRKETQFKSDCEETGEEKTSQVKSIIYLRCTNGAQF